MNIVQKISAPFILVILFVAGVNAAEPQQRWLAIDQECSDSGFYCVMADQDVEGFFANFCSCMPLTPRGERKIVSLRAWAIENLGDENSWNTLCCIFFGLWWVNGGEQYLDSFVDLVRCSYSKPCVELYCAIPSVLRRSIAPFTFKFFLIKCRALGMTRVNMREFFAYCSLVALSRARLTDNIFMRHSSPCLYCVRSS